jgi:hypothetical protein
MEFGAAGYVITQTLLASPISLQRGEHGIGPNSGEDRK